MKLLLLLSLLVPGACAVHAQDYYLGASKDGVTEYRIISVTVNNRYHVMEALDRIKPATGKLQEFRQQVMEERKKDNLSTDGFDKLGYYRRKMQYSCKDKKFRQMECTYYDLNGKVIDQTEPDEKTPWMTVPAGTIRELEFKKVCSVGK